MSKPVFNEEIGSHLGKSTIYKSIYDPTLLVREKRENNREKYGISSTFFNHGMDIWNCYEVSFLTDKGRPISVVAKICYPSNGNYIVESKSLKLYLNSLNMYKCGESKQVAIKKIKKIIKKDLSALLEVPVQLSFFEKAKNKKIFKDFISFESIITDELLDKISFTDYIESPSLLQKGESKELKICFPLLRSQCKITNQPDWGDLYLHFKGAEGIDVSSLLQYLVSFREESHFHEEVVEMIYKRIWDRFKPEELMVAAVYTRRGGIDINPIRASHEHLLEVNLVDVKKHCQKTLRQ